MYLEDFENRVLPVKNKLYRFALRYLLDEDDAKDIVQEVFLRVWNRKESMQDYQNMEAWCMTMVKNLCLDKLKSKQYIASKMKVDVDIQLNEQSPYENVAINDTMQKLKEFITLLPEKQRLVFQLRDISGHSYQEICNIAALDMSQVKVYLHRARKFLKDKLQNTESYGL